MSRSEPIFKIGERVRHWFGDSLEGDGSKGTISDMVWTERVPKPRWRYPQWRYIIMWDGNDEPSDGFPAYALRSISAVDQLADLA